MYFSGHVNDEALADIVANNVENCARDLTGRWTALRKKAPADIYESGNRSVLTAEIRPGSCLRKFITANK